MLILGGKQGHKFYIGEDVSVMITKVVKNKNGEMEVYLGFEAPKDIRILREPIMEAIKRKREYENEGTIGKG